MGIRNIAKKRAPVEVEAVAMTLPRQATSIRHAMWNERSRVLAEESVTQTEMRNVAAYSSALIPSLWYGGLTQTGTVNHRVVILPYPSVSTMLGKKYWNVCVRRLQCCISTNRYIL